MRDEGPLCRLHPAKLQKKKKKLGTGGGSKAPGARKGPLHLPPSSGTGFCIALAGFVHSPPKAGASSACNPCGFYLQARARGKKRGGTQPRAIKEPGKNNRLRLGNRYTMALKKRTAEESLMALPKGKKCLPTCKQELIIEKKAQESVKTICAMRKRLGPGGRRQQR